MGQKSQIIPWIVLSAILLIVTTTCSRQPEVKWLPETEDYASWSRWPDDPLDYPIPGHLASYRLIFINQAGKKTTTEIRGDRVHETYPDGTVIIKEIYDRSAPAGTAPKILTAMVKSPDHAEARGGWVWVTRDVATGKEQVIDYEFCFDCHADANEPHPYGDGNPDGEHRDYVFFPYRTSHQ